MSKQNYKNGLYHIALGIPTIRLPNKQITLRYTKHALESAQMDQYGDIKLPRSINPSLCQVVEVEMQNNMAVKLLLRMPYNLAYDLCMVINPDGSVRTVWLNSKRDKHSTLRAEKYVQHQ